MRPLELAPEQTLEENWPHVFSSFTSFVTSSQQTLVARLQKIEGNGKFQKG